MRFRLARFSGKTRETSASYRAWIQAKANRQDAFFVRPAGALDVCNALPPVKGAGRAGM